MRHLPFTIAGDWHGFPFRVRAPHLLARRMCNCMGLILRFRPHPTPLHIADNSLSAFVDVDVFNRYFLLSFATVSIEGFQKCGVGARKFVRLAQVLASPFKCLFTDHGAAIAFHRGIVASDELRCHHALQFVVRIYADGAQRLRRR